MRMRGKYLEQDYLDKIRESLIPVVPWPMYTTTPGVSNGGTRIFFIRGIEDCEYDIQVENFQNKTYVTVENGLKITDWRNKKWTVLYHGQITRRTEKAVIEEIATKFRQFHFSLLEEGNLNW